MSLIKTKKRENSSLKEPKRPKKRLKDTQDTQNGEDEISVKPSSSKKRKEKSTPTSSQPKGETIDATELSKSSNEKEKRRKSKSAPTEDVDMQDVLSDDEQSKRHRKLLSKYKKAAARAQNTQPSEDATETTDAMAIDAPVDTYGLTPLPLPARAKPAPYNPDFSTLPPNFASPLIADTTSDIPFSSFPINPRILQNLDRKGYSTAFAIQATVLPLLLPGSKHHDGDLCVSAATGSGKTLSYVLPLVQALQAKATTALRGLIVVPTRELAGQVLEVCRLCTAGTKLKTELALGNRPIQSERELLIADDQVWNPIAHEAFWEQPVVELDRCFLESPLIIDNAYRSPGFITEFSSRVDILICTPGRLVDHIQSTTGFTLRDLEWLVIDEGDRLLDQEFQGWLSVISEAIEETRKPVLGDKVDELSEMLDIPLLRPEVKKVVLSATMTRDTGKISGLNLRNPKLVVVDDAGVATEAQISDLADEEKQGSDTEKDKEENGQANGDRRNIFTLPTQLHEYAIAIGDGSKRPLYLLNLLRSLLLPTTEHTIIGFEAKSKEDESSRSDSDSSSGSDSGTDSESGGEAETSSGSVSLSSSDISSSSSSSSSEDWSDSDSDSTSSDDVTSDSDSSSDSNSDSDSSSDSSSSLSSKHSPISKSIAPHIPTVLVFTRSNSSAHRLSRLLSLLDPALKPALGLLTSTLPRAVRQRTLHRFAAGSKLRVLIASDLVSRGLDLPHLAHVVNYDPPSSLEGYIHRVGRTARAGRAGKAWTLLDQKEAGWFWNRVAKAEEIRRGKAVDRYRVQLVEGEEKDLQSALDVLAAEVKEGQ
jgi:ATP-dependent RNA helicase DDX51/DBP6